MNYYYSAANGAMTFTSVMMLVVIIGYIVAWACTMQIVVKAAAEKGYDNISGRLWFIGFFGLIVTPCVIVAALPDRNAQRVIAGSFDSAQDDLPSV